MDLTYLWTPNYSWHTDKDEYRPISKKFYIGYFFRKHNLIKSTWSKYSKYFSSSNLYCSTYPHSNPLYHFISQFIWVYIEVVNISVMHNKYLVINLHKNSSFFQLAILWLRSKILLRICTLWWKVPFNTRPTTAISVLDRTSVVSFTSSIEHDLYGTNTGHWKGWCTLVAINNNINYNIRLQNKCKQLNNNKFNNFCNGVTGTLYCHKQHFQI